MYRYVDVSNMTPEELIKKYDFYVCKARNSRVRAMDLAVKETLFKLKDLSPAYLKNGPLSDVKGTFVILVPKEHYVDTEKVFSEIGYCDEFYSLDFNTDGKKSDIDFGKNLTWKKRSFVVNEAHIQDKEEYIQQGADKRPFKIIGQDGQIKDLVGYRGDGTETGKRALPVEDCRVLVNLSMPTSKSRILDPFAGGGGIVYQAVKQGLDVYSNDIDETVAPGIESYGSNHTTNDTRYLYFDENFGMISTEVPFSPNVTDIVCDGLTNVSMYLDDNGMMSIMCADHQVEAIKKAMKVAKMKPCGETKIDRKGTDVTILVYTNSYEQYKEIQMLEKDLEPLHYKGDQEDEDGIEI